ncbi:glycosyl hydrolase family 3 C-terminal domain-containing protein [Ilyonectria sp. MPI-CAGE-AT-0026]|nr:glycosyl hydrolase family 3 C-terminal domain-containing protein [Ilyonectria sp. MPI-CAGE-AT-0026]
MSDWGGVNSTADSINAGVDLEMPGPTRWRKIPNVLAAIKAGEITEATINQRARCVLHFIERLKGFDNPIWGEPTEQAINKPEHAALIREPGAKGIVLLKNQDQLLPLTKEKVKGKKIALLAYAKECLAHGGGSASVSLEGNPGFTCNIYESGYRTLLEALNGYEKSQMTILDGQTLDNKEIDLIGIFQPPETTMYYFTLSGLGPSQLVIDGDIILEQRENCGDAMGFLFGGVPVPLVKFPMEQGRKYRIHIKSAPPAPNDEHDKDILSEAVELAKTSDYSIIFTGNNPSWETEGQDQASFDLPKNGSQDRLVEAVAAVCQRVVIVNSTGVAVALPWLDQVQCLLQTWFPGQEAGQSIVDVIMVAQNPEGHLTCTFPKRIEDCPAYGNFPGDPDTEHGLQVKYEEGVFVGYRHFNRLPSSKVNFPFGFGLSYTTFALQNLAVREISEDEYAVSVAVSNTGDVKGATAVQLYVGGKSPSPNDSLKVLVGFKKARDFAFWDEGRHEWVVDPGDYNFSVGRSTWGTVATVVSIVGRTECIE